MIRRSIGRRSGSATLPIEAPVRIVTATKVSSSLFWRATYLGRSLTTIPESLRPAVTVYADNTGPAARGLPALYNEAIGAAAADEILFFVHDDVYLHDWFVAARAREAMSHFDLAGVAGAVDPDLSQPSWTFAFDDKYNKTHKQADVTRSGSINHFDHVQPKVETFGPTPRECQLLDGVILILNAGRAQQVKARFDERFTFHFYDLDFCRTARSAGLRIGTWPITVTHDSIGGFDSDAFRAAATEYIGKWRT